ncbi:hypothetical protein GCM10010174_34440 [Kutzneria viridogrisea]|uniref:Uncharacterized protein n=2 Tax=Kutzneria TaxID=43356 RepID=W5WFE6_9PSEU|nr:hypothetical protein [Kutzneria albida]AHH96889.1 hypothetical protein KALB_3525 [Kutzneria albida DSM 43870]MBA8927888.1 hypothetical protein [Kutzneria viridogrisea]
MTTIPGQRTPADRFGAGGPLVDALLSGPFHLALDLAIQHRELSLDGIRRRLAMHGVQVSQASLSYWRRGLRSPEGERSLATVHALEEVLGLPRGVLSRLLPHQRGTGWAPAVRLDTALGLPEFTDIDLDANGRLSVMSLHNTALVGPTRGEESVHVRCVVRGQAEGADRWVCFFASRDPAHWPVVTATSGCRPGLVRRHGSHGLIAVELEFGRRLTAGDLYVFEYELGYLGSAPTTGYHQHGLRTPARDLVLQVRFHRDAVPRRCYGYESSGEAAAHRVETTLPLGGSHSVHTVALDAHPGVHGIRWEWD